MDASTQKGGSEMAKKTRERMFPNLELLLWQNNLPVSKLAKLMQMDRSAIYKKLAGDRKWNLTEMRRVEAILIRYSESNGINTENINIDYIFKEAQK